jgi:hypothetical protein
MSSRWKIFRRIEDYHMERDSQTLLQAKILVNRLARLSADSIWARRASGLRASIDKAVAQLENGQPVDQERFDHLVALGFEMLEKAAEEIPVPEDILFGSRES